MLNNDLGYLQHIRDECDFITTHLEDITFEKFLSSEVLKRAIARSIEIIGEASKKLSPNITTKYSEIEWRELAKMRDVLIHQYFGIDYEIVWDVSKNRIPLLLIKIREVIKNECE